MENQSHTSWKVGRRQMTVDTIKGDWKASYIQPNLKDVLEIRFLEL